jgi:hypothetical protein
MMVRMSEQLAAGHQVLQIWIDAVERLAFVFLPLVAALILTARELIATLYQPQYLPSVPVFIVATALIGLAALPVDGVLRVFAATRFLIVMNVVRLAVVLAGINWALSTYGLRGAIGITVVAQATAKVVAVARIRGLFGARWRDVLPWRALGHIVTASLLAVVPAWWAERHLQLPPLLRGASTAVLYGAAYLLIMATWQTSLRQLVAARLGWQRVSNPGR